MSERSTAAGAATSSDPAPGPQPSSGSGFASSEAAAARLELADGWREAVRLFPMRWPEPYLDLATSDAGAAVRRMGAPDPAELEPAPGDLADPVGEMVRSPQAFVVRKHRDRAILLVTARCHFYCRFCFRRSFPDGSHRDPTAAELDAAIRYLVDDPEIDEVILSGGDPLVLDDRRLGELIEALRPGVETLRIHTRAPVHFPERVTSELVQVLAAGPPTWLVTHFNHAVELTEGSLAALDRLRTAGIPLLNQSVLLAGVNDSVEALVALFKGLYRVRVKPYYLHHPDRVPGAAAFRVPIHRGLELFEAARSAVGGVAAPQYVIDLPDGSGKLPVSVLEELGEGRYRAPSGLVIDDV